MRSLVFGFLACWICVVPTAHASTGSQGPSAKGSSIVGASASHSTHNSGARNQSSFKASQTSRKQLLLENPTQAPQSTSPAVETLSSLANGSSLVNPWFPEKGAIGVRVKVSW